MGKKLIIIAFLAFAVIRFITQQPYISANESKISELNDKIEYEQRRLEQVNKLYEQSNTDEYIEKVAREKLNLVYPGEKVFIDVMGK